MTSSGINVEAPQGLLAFWFGEPQQGFADDAHRRLWFAGGATFDRQCTELFGETIERIYTAQLDHWFDSARGTLAYILLCDQLTRNIYRDSAEAFRADPLALKAAQHGVRAGMDRELGFDERAFFYLPFEHSEDPLNQHTSVGLFTQLRDETPAGQRHLTGSYLQHAHQHRDTILRFGRFPYRNAALGRPNTAAETEFLRSLE